MKAAFHFSADGTGEVPLQGYDVTYLRQVFRAVRFADTGREAHLTLDHGDACAWRRWRDPSQRLALERALCPPAARLARLERPADRRRSAPHAALWRALAYTDGAFLQLMLTTNTYVISVDGLEEGLRDQIHAMLLKTLPDAYYGALQVDETIPAHYALYHVDLVPVYRYYHGCLRLFFGWEDDEVDHGLATLWRRSKLFDAVEWEDRGTRDARLSVWDSWAGARWLAPFSQSAPGELAIMAHEVAHTLDEIAPAMSATLRAVVEHTRHVTTWEQATEAARACQLYVDGLARVARELPDNRHARVASNARSAHITRTARAPHRLKSGETGVDAPIEPIEPIARFESSQDVAKARYADVSKDEEGERIPARDDVRALSELLELIHRLDSLVGAADLTSLKRDERTAQRADSAAGAAGARGRNDTGPAVQVDVERVGGELGRCLISGSFELLGLRGALDAPPPLPQHLRRR